MSPARQADLGPLPRLVGLAAANAQPEPVGDDGDVFGAQDNQFRAAQRADEAEQQLMITADGDGSNGSRVRLLKVELQKLWDETGLTLQVCHYPAGTSKWNEIEHKLFCHITQTWRGKPLTSRETGVELIASSSSTKNGLTMRCDLDTRSYPKGIKVSDEEMATLKIKGDTFHPKWNYTVSPRVTP
jgi:hypothetical protein